MRAFGNKNTESEMKLNPQQIQFYNDEGYLILPEFLTHKECDDIIIDAGIEAKGHFTNLLNLHEASVSVKNLIKDPRILELADQLHQSRMIPIGSIFFFCKPGNDLEQGSNMHQDNYAPKSPYGSYFVIGVALDHANERNGSLIVYPGTHKCGELNSIPSKNFEYDTEGKISKAYPIGNPIEIPPDSVPLQLQYTKGSLILLHAHTVHGAPKNPSQTHWRRKIYLHYIKNGHPFWPGWNAKRQLIERD